MDECNGGQTSEKGNVAVNSTRHTERLRIVHDKTFALMGFCQKFDLPAPLREEWSTNHPRQMLGQVWMSLIYGIAYPKVRMRFCDFAQRRLPGQRPLRMNTRLIGETPPHHAGVIGGPFFSERREYGPRS